MRVCVYACRSVPKCIQIVFVYVHQNWHISQKNIGIKYRQFLKRKTIAEEKFSRIVQSVTGLKGGLVVSLMHGELGITITFIHSPSFTESNFGYNYKQLSEDGGLRANKIVQALYCSEEFTSWYYDISTKYTGQ